MMNYALMPTGTLASHSQLIPVKSIHEEIVTLDSPALQVLIDFTLKPRHGIHKHVKIHEALHDMQLLQVKSLFIVDEANTILGHISSRDIQGIRAIMLAQQNGIKVNELSVGQLMTPYQQMRTLQFTELSNARVGHIVRILHETMQNYLFVVETPEEGKTVVRGLFSISRISRQLGQPLTFNLHAQSIADINRRVS